MNRPSIYTFINHVLKLRCQKTKNPVLTIICTILISALMIAAVTGVAAAEPAKVPADTQGHWAESAIFTFINEGIVSGYPDHTFKPNKPVTRAEFVSMVNHACYLTEMGNTGFPDVAANEWYSHEVRKAAAAGYICGYPDGSFRPEVNISRQEAACALNHIIQRGTSSDQSVLQRFADASAIPEWSKAALISMVSEGLMKGYPDQTFKPHDPITRAEAVSILNLGRETGRISLEMKQITYDQAGIFGPSTGIETISSHLTISAAGTTLQNTVVQGDLTLAETIGDGDVTLKNVTVKGNTIIKGGGDHSVTFEDCTIASMSINQEGVRVVAAGNTVVNMVQLESGATLVQTTSTNSAGYETVSISKLLPAGATVTLKGSFSNINVDAANLNLTLTGGTVTRLEVSAKATGTVIDLDSDARISNLELNAAVGVNGQGAIDNARVTAIGVSFEKPPVNLDNPYNVAVSNGAVTSPAGGGKTTGIGSGTGSGGGDGNAPLNLVSSIPADGSSGVSTNPTIKLTFDRGVVRDHWDTNQNCFSLKSQSGKSVPITVYRAANYLDESEKEKIYVTADVSLTSGTTYILTISGNLTANNDNTMGFDETISFTVAGSPGGGGGGGDSTAPAFAASYPKSGNIGQTWASLLVKANETGTVYYVALPDDDPAPTAVQVKAGHTANTIDAVLKGSLTITANTEGTLIISGLATGINYDLYIVAEDSILNLQATPSKIELATSADDNSSAAAALAQAGDKTAGSSFDLDLSGVRDAAGTNMVGSIGVTISSDVDGPVFNGNLNFADGNATALIAANQVTTAGSHTLTVNISGITPQPTVPVNVVAASQISSALSTAEIDQELKEGLTSTVTVTLRDAYNNPIINATKNLKIAVTLSNNDITNNETYNIDGTGAASSTTLSRSGIATDGNGRWQFTVQLPAIIDPGDGISLQVTQNNDSTIGTAFSYIADDRSSASVAAPANTTRREAIQIGISGAKDVYGIALNGAKSVCIASDKGIVDNQSVGFINGGGTVQVGTTDGTTVGTHTITVAIDGVTPQPSFQVTIANSAIDPNNSTVTVVPDLNIGSTSTFTVTLKDADGNPLANTTKNSKIVVTIINNDPSSNETYILDATSITTNISIPRSAEPTDENGQWTFTVTLPAGIDSGDGMSIQVTQNNGTAIGPEFSYNMN